MKIKDQLVTSSHHWGDDSKKSSITVHETANTSRGAGAQAHANLQANGNVRQASWHIQVDDTEAIRSFADDMKCWHAGRQAADSLSLEICVNSDSDYDTALANAAEVVKQWRKAHGLGRDDVVSHNYWTGKNCPTQLLASGKWDEFVASTDPDGSTKAPTTGGSSGSSSSGSGKSVATLAKEVIDGKHGSGEARKRSLGSQYSAVQAEVNKRLSGSSSSGSRKSTATLAKEVIDGKHGSGDARKRALGSRYSEVQAEVNRRLGGGSSSSGSRKSTTQLAREVIDGKYGSGEARRKALGSRYSAVQSKVNELLSGGSSSGGGRSVKSLADEVIRRGINGDARKRFLGSRYNAVQAEINRRYS